MARPRGPARHLTPRSAAGALAVIVMVIAGACVEPAATPCNSDADCAAEKACTLGVCAAVPSRNDAGPSDAGPPDAGPSDAGPPDAGPPDAGPSDAGPTDAGPSDAGPPDAGGCASDEHDGGDGVCVALDACSPGFAFFYVDTDGDGVGAGPLSSDCAALPLAPGRSDLDTDCGPADPDRFQLQSGFDDGDLDGATAGPAQACVGDVPEQGILAVERGPPHLAHAQDGTSSGSNNPWTNPWNGWGCCGGTASADLDPSAASAELVLADVVCLAVPTRLDLVRARAHVRVPAGQSAQDLTLSVALVEGGTTRDARTATATWAAGTFTDVSLEGSLGDWGLVESDPTALCNELLDLRVSVLPNGSYNNSVEVDYVVLELLGDEDCAPTDGNAFAPHDLYADADGDDAAGGPVLTSCVGDDVLTTWGALVYEDCDDTDGDAHPGQSNYFTSQRNGGGWDYNCNGGVEKRDVTAANGCADPADGTCAVTSTTQRSGSCGQQVPADYCPAAPPCDLVADTARIACR